MNIYAHSPIYCVYVYKCSHLYIYIHIQMLTHLYTHDEHKSEIRCNIYERTATCCNTLQHAELQCVAVSCSEMSANLRYAAIYINTLQHAATHCNMQSCSVLQCVAVRWARTQEGCYRLQVAVCRSVLQCVAVCRSAVQCVAACCSVLQCVVVCCSVSQ